MNKEEIRARHSNKPTYVSPNFGDGGWHITPGCVRFKTEWEPLTDHILVKLFDLPKWSSCIAEPESVTPNIQTRTGIVLKVGPGKWIPGSWRKRNVSHVLSHKSTNRCYKQNEHGIWEWLGGYRQTLTVKPGDTVVIGRYTDWESNESDWGENIVICQEADVRVLLKEAT